MEPAQKLQELGRLLTRRNELRVSIGELEHRGRIGGPVLKAALRNGVTEMERELTAVLRSIDVMCYPTQDRPLSDPIVITMDERGRRSYRPTTEPWEKVQRSLVPEGAMS